MKLVSWNCQGAFRKKIDVISKLKPDLLVVQECECLEKLEASLANSDLTSSFWYGDNKNKGIGLFSYSNYSFELLPEFNPQYRYILPFKVTGPDKSFVLYIIWAMNNKEIREARYIGQIWLAINYYSALLHLPSLLIGDFNSNQIWDYKGRVGNHSDVVGKLSVNNIISVYHHLNREEHGRETKPTFFMQKKMTKPYHIDYCFVSKEILDTVEEFEIGEYDDWISYSDHVPLSICF